MPLKFGLGVYIIWSSVGSVGVPPLLTTAVPLLGLDVIIIVEEFGPFPPNVSLFNTGIVIGVSSLVEDKSRIASG